MKYTHFLGFDIGTGTTNSGFGEKYLANLIRTEGEEKGKQLKFDDWSMMLQKNNRLEPLTDPTKTKLKIEFCEPTVQERKNGGRLSIEIRGEIEVVQELVDEIENLLSTEFEQQQVISIRNRQFFESKKKKKMKK